MTTNMSAPRCFLFLLFFLACLKGHCFSQSPFLPVVINTWHFTNATSAGMILYMYITLYLLLWVKSLSLGYNVPGTYVVRNSRLQNVGRMMAVFFFNSMLILDMFMYLNSVVVWLSVKTFSNFILFHFCVPY
jgi:hypothetical protein